jgi:dihydroxy-acid dehydratase
MKTVSYTDARNQLASLMEAANADREPVAITRNGAASVVLVDAAELQARKVGFTPPAPRYTRGVQAKFAFNASSASKGAVLDNY